MTVETKLRSAMAEAVAPAHADTDRLVAAARRRGMGIRRRRQALGAVGVAAAVGLVVTAPTVIAGSRGTDIAPAASMSVGSTPLAMDSSQTQPLTGRSTAAALLYAVGLQGRGTATDFHGQGGDASGPAGYAFFRFTPEGGARAGEVAINVQRFWTSPAKQGDKLAGRLAQCDSWMEDCTTATLPDGSRLLTYGDRSDYGDRKGIRRVVELYRTDQVRLVVSASNGYDVTERDERITRSQPVLTTAQLEAIVTQPWWGPDLPIRFTELGATLKPYSSIGGAIEATPTSPATP
jgi:hypothetical protein